MVLKAGGMIQRQTERLARALWTFGQPLTQRPDRAGVPISDLFVWRNDEDWKTFFDLMDVSGLLEDRYVADRHVTLFFFDDRGSLFLKQRLNLASHRRQTLDLSDFVSKSNRPLGTFSVFHSHTPEFVSELGSFLAERGYVSYRYKGSPLRSYVHGNLDAISFYPDGSTHTLGTVGFLNRQYRLQHELLGPSSYEVGIVNPCSRGQRFLCRVLSAHHGEVLESLAVRLPTRGCHMFPIRVVQSQQCRIVIESRLVMARPLVFRICGQTMDVFHG